MPYFALKIVCSTHDTVYRIAVMIAMTICTGMPDDTAYMPCIRVCCLPAHICLYSVRGKFAVKSQQYPALHTIGSIVRQLRLLRDIR